MFDGDSFKTLDPTRAASAAEEVILLASLNLDDRVECL
jgi:hypothetical protein